MILVYNFISFISNTFYNSDMEEIVLVSDNHGQRKPLEYLKENYPVTDYFIHCGDSEMHPNQLSGFTSVQGNNDFFHAYPPEFYSQT